MEEKGKLQLIYEEGYEEGWSEGYDAAIDFMVSNEETTERILKILYYG